MEKIKVLVSENYGTSFQTLIEQQLYHYMPARVKQMMNFGQVLINGDCCQMAESIYDLDKLYDVDKIHLECTTEMIAKLLKSSFESKEFFPYTTTVDVVVDYNGNTSPDRAYEQAVRPRSPYIERAQEALSDKSLYNQKKKQLLGLIETHPMPKKHNLEDWEEYCATLIYYVSGIRESIKFIFQSEEPQQ